MFFGEELHLWVDLDLSWICWFWWTLFTVKTLDNVSSSCRLLWLVRIDLSRWYFIAWCIIVSHLERMQHQTWRWSTYCECFLYDCVEKKIDWNSSHMQCSDTVSLQCESSHVFSGLLTDWISCHSVNTCKVSLQCESSHAVLNSLL